ncbi:MAG: PKD domain-containing protein, partial [Myxococcota bacterium]
MIDLWCAPDLGDGLGDGLRGPTPLDVECVAMAPAGATWDTVRWSFGDGGVAEGVVATHRYAEPGVYDLSVAWVGYRDPDGVASAPSVVRSGYVTACGPASASFRWRQVAGPVVELVDTS